MWFKGLSRGFLIDFGGRPLVTNGSFSGFLSPFRPEGAQETAERHGDIHGPKPYNFIGFGDIHGPKRYEFIGFGAIHGPKPYKFIGFGAIHGPLVL